MKTGVWLYIVDVEVFISFCCLGRGPQAVNGEAFAACSLKVPVPKLYLFMVALVLSPHHGVAVSCSPIERNDPWETGGIGVNKGPILGQCEYETRKKQHDLKCFDHNIICKMAEELIGIWQAKIMKQILGFQPKTFWVLKLFTGTLYYWQWKMILNNVYFWRTKVLLSWSPYIYLWCPYNMLWAYPKKMFLWGSNYLVLLYWFSPFYWNSRSYRNNFRRKKSQLELALPKRTWGLIEHLGIDKIIWHTSMIP